MQTQLVFIDSNAKYGFHISKEPLLENTFKKFDDAPLNAYQIYVAQNKSYKLPKIDPQDLLKTRHYLQRNGKYGNVFIHSSLLHNLAGKVEGPSHIDFHKNLSLTLDGLKAELDVGVGMGGAVVVHTGAAKNKTEGIQTIAKSITRCLTETSEFTKNYSRLFSVPEKEIVSERKLYLENAAGEGNKLGSTLDEFRRIFELVPSELHSQIGVCIDTMHIFGAGQYDFGKEESVVKFYHDFDEKIGLDYLKVFHLNDSAVPFGAKKDRHAQLLFGEIFSPVRFDEEDGRLGLKTFTDFAVGKSIPLIGEPPGNEALEGTPYNGGFWDYEVMKQVCHLHGDTFCCC